MREIKGSTRVCGLIGNPVEHSISPLIHNSLAVNCGIDMLYATFKVESGKVAEAVKGAFALNILGMNVTVPHKQEVIEVLDDIDELAANIGAVNTLVRTDKGYKGYNTDIIGLDRELMDEGIKLEGENVVILGAGGASRAITFLCASRKAANVYVLNRSIDKCENIVNDVNKAFGIQAAKAMKITDYGDIPVDDYVVIQTTSVGLYPNVEDVVIEDMSFYERAKAGVDIIYNPAVTRFMKLMQAAGKPAYNGLKMLLYQGVAAFELWNNCVIEKEECDRLYRLMEDSMKLSAKKNNIILIGFMGSGKSTFGRWISKNKGYSFIDTDEYIVEREGMSINDIFELKGEEYFRSLETQVIRELIDTTDNSVISVGGGLPVREENRKLLKQLGKVVYLDASVEELVRRLGKDTDRPLLKGQDLRERIVDLKERRLDAYMDAKEISIHTDNKRFCDMYEEIGI